MRSDADEEGDQVADNGPEQDDQIAVCRPGMEF